MNETILLADDEEGIRNVLSIALKDSGYNVLTAENGERAYHIFQQHKPPIVLSDIKMPVMDGISLLKKIKSHSPDTEVIMVSGHGDIDVAVQSLKYEAADFIFKPISNEVLEVALKRVHEKISMRRKLKEYTENLEHLVKEKSEKLVEIERVSARKYQQLASRYQQLFDEVPCYISVIDKDFKLTEVNRRFKEDFGDSIGACCFEVYKDRQAQCPNCPVSQTFDDGQSHYSESVVTSLNKEKHNLLIWTAPIYDSSGNISQVMEMSADVTQMRKLQSHLSSLGLLIGSISHSIKGLLTGLDGGMYLLNSGFAKENEAQIKEGWETVKLIVSRIRKMVLDILFYAKERELKWEKVEVLHFAEEVANTIEAKMFEQNIEFIRSFDSLLGTVELDAGVVHSALMNILENAIDACIEDKSGRVHQVIFGAKQDEDHVIFEISDNGIGMSEETREKLFTLFFSSKGQKGTGLGLFICDKIIRQHGGVIVVDSEPGLYSKFTLKIPRIFA